MLLPNRDVQTFLKEKGDYKGDIDGKVGPATNAASWAFLTRSNISATTWSDARKRIAVEQLMFKDEGKDVGTVDGYVGPQTRQAYEDYIHDDRENDKSDSAIAHQLIIWPRQKDVPSFYGARGVNQVLLALPYPMKLAWDQGTIVKRISLHEKVAPSAERALKKVLEAYGSRIPQLGLDLYGGSLNVRKMRGGTQWSMHSWGIAIDFDPEHNQLRWGRDLARLARSEYIVFWQAWEAEGWINLGRERNYDWMHVQAARL